MAAAVAVSAPAANPHAGTIRDALEWLIRQRRDGRPRDPRVAAQLLARLRIPAPKRVIHVTGTNGKGTVSYLLAAIAQAQGYRCGRFTSPHVEDLCERIAIDGALIDPERVRCFVADQPAAGVPGVGFFEWTLALGLDAFAAAAADMVVLEAGVGARFDATLAVENVVGTVLTNVTLDHQETLGASVAAIAWDKAAVARPGIPLVTAARGEALAVVQRVAAEVGAPVWRVDARHALARWPRGAPIRTPLDWPPTRVENARLALALARLLGWSESALAQGLTSPPPPARFERFRIDTEDGPLEVLLDGAHDPTAGARLAAALPAGYVLLFGSLARKRGADTLRALRPKALGVWLTQAEPGEPLVAVPAEPGPEVVQEADIELALRLAARAAQRSGALLVIAGSLHLAGQVRPWLRARSQVGEPAGAMLAGQWDASVSSV